MPTAHSRAVVLAVLLSLATTAAEARRSHHHHPSHHRNHSHGDVASYYSRGQRTASGERFNPNEFTAAHRTLPFNSLVRVTNRHNGHSVVVRINDRGPIFRGRTLDLSRAAARRLGMLRRGVVSVRLEVGLTVREIGLAFHKLISLTERREVVWSDSVSVSGTGYLGVTQPRSDRAAQQEPTGADAYAMGWEPEAELPMLPPLRLLVIQPLNIIRQYIESLFMPAGAYVRMNCPDGNPLPLPLRMALEGAARAFGCAVTVTSAYRSPAHNRAVGGARRSQHMSCKAVDFIVPCAAKESVFAWAKRQPQIRGVGIYRSAAIHMDIRKSKRLVTWDWRKSRRYAHRRHHRNARV